ncbi:hypothetical protein PoB_001572700 [Plakobranchus ocellatus]|uniref:Uncharacterized protein n=1 Tax=Plakobranchus ocellatus TaxID=259542 RepID=A0AAV3Z202_9GAST|nr:hypothetical protein PoB_001572700 [Plakobranchus ocellatus]
MDESTSEKSSGRPAGSGSASCSKRSSVAGVVARVGGRDSNHSTDVSFLRKMLAAAVPASQSQPAVVVVQAQVRGFKPGLHTFTAVGFHSRMVYTAAFHPCRPADNSGYATSSAIPDHTQRNIHTHISGPATADATTTTTATTAAATTAAAAAAAATTTATTAAARAGSYVMMNQGIPSQTRRRLRAASLVDSSPVFLMTSKSLPQGAAYSELNPSSCVCLCARCLRVYCGAKKRTTTTPNKKESVPVLYLMQGKARQGHMGCCCCCCLSQC